LTFATHGAAAFFFTHQMLPADKPVLKTPALSSSHIQRTNAEKG